MDLAKTLEQLAVATLAERTVHLRPGERGKRQRRRGVEKRQRGGRHGFERRAEDWREGETENLQTGSQ